MARQRVMRSTSLAIVAGILALFSALAVQATEIEISGAVPQPRKLSLEDFRKLPRVEIPVEEKGKAVTYSGVPLVELLRLAGAPLGEALRGANLRLYVLVEAADGYEVVFALAELDPAMTDTRVFVVDEMNGRPLPDGVGPVRLVVPGEKRHARWVRQVVRFRVLEG
jgi:DMSO/TMAO reductase YedYZ molybdopterin-dependent catalytic subunit